MSNQDITPISNPAVDFRHEAGNHGSRISRLESDVFHVTQLITTDIHEKLAALQSSVDTVKQILGDGHVLFQKLEDAHVANAKDIAEMKEARSGRLFYFIYPAAAAALVLAIEHAFCKGTP
jgi:hypothetical protein